MSDGTTSPPVDAIRSAILHVRSTTTNLERERATLAALEALSADGVIDDVAVQMWPERVSLRAAGAAREAYVDAFDSFQDWARRNGMSICPPFVLRRRESAITREKDEVILTPACFLTLYDGTELVGVYPCSDGSSVSTIEDWLAQSGRAAAPRDDTDADSPDGDRVLPAGAGTGTE